MHFCCSTFRDSGNHLSLMLRIASAYAWLQCYPFPESNEKTSMRLLAFTLTLNITPFIRTINLAESQRSVIVPQLSGETIMRQTMAAYGSMAEGQSPWERAWTAAYAERRLCLWRTARRCLCLYLCGLWRYISAKLLPIFSPLVPNLGVNYPNWEMGPLDLDNGLLLFY